MPTQIQPLDLSGVELSITLTPRPRENIPSTDYKAKPDKLMPRCEKNLRWMLWFTGLPCFRSSICCVKWFFPIAINIQIAGACFCMLWYPSYYINQASVWTADMCLIWIVHSYLLFLQSRWDVSSCFEFHAVPKWADGISLTFYFLFLIYWLYFAIIMFQTNTDSSVLIQLGNVYMSLAWWFFFSTAAALYYFVCSKLQQRVVSINKWLVTIREKPPTLEQFYSDYNFHCKKIRRFGVHWNLVVFLGFLLLTFHVPIDLVSIIYDKNYYDIPGAVIKGLALSWYLYCICKLDDLEERVISTLYKSRAFSLDDMALLEKYIGYRGLGLDFYGIKINTGYIMKVVILLANFIIPSIYAVLKGIVLKE